MRGPAAAWVCRRYRRCRLPAADACAPSLRSCCTAQPCHALAASCCIGLPPPPQANVAGAPGCRRVRRSSTSSVGVIVAAVPPAIKSELRERLPGECISQLGEPIGARTSPHPHCGAAAASMPPDLHAPAPPTHTRSRRGEFVPGQLRGPCGRCRPGAAAGRGGRGRRREQPGGRRAGCGRGGEAGRQRGADGCRLRSQRL